MLNTEIYHCLLQSLNLSPVLRDCHKQYFVGSVYFYRVSYLVLGFSVLQLQVLVYDGLYSKCTMFIITLL